MRHHSTIREIEDKGPKQPRKKAYVTPWQWVFVHKPLLQKLGIAECLLLSYLAETMSRLSADQQDADMLKEGYVRCTIRDLEEHLNMKIQLQHLCLRRLKKKGLIEVVLKGFPPSRYAKVNAEAVADLVR